MTARMDLHDYIRELTERHTHREPYEYEQDDGHGNATRYNTHHTTTHPPLITQLWGSTTPAGQGGEIGAAAPSSRPAASLDAIDAAARIDLAAARWLKDFGEDDDDDTIQVIRRIYALTPTVHRCSRASGRHGTDCCTYHAIEVAARSWWVQARVLTGWDTPARKLAGTCPLCAHYGTVLVRFSSSLATCTECHEAWDEYTIGMLAEHIRLEAESERFTPPPPDNECRCIWPQDLQVGRIMLCPDCGSRYCIKTQDLIVTTLPNHQAS